MITLFKLFLSVFFKPLPSVDEVNEYTNLSEQKMARKVLKIIKYKMFNGENKVVISGTNYNDHFKNTITNSMNENGWDVFFKVYMDTVNESIEITWTPLTNHES